MAPSQCSILMVVSLTFPRMRELSGTNTLAYLFIMSFTKSNVYYNHTLQHNLFICALFCQLAILSTCHFINLPFCHLAILSTCHFVNLPFFEFAIFPTCYFSNLLFCQLAIFMNLLFFQLVVRDKHSILLFWNIIDWEECLLQLHLFLCKKSTARLSILV
jgi:hypothetical protein